jgi:erythromycin esterase
MRRQTDSARAPRPRKQAHDPAHDPQPRHDRRIRSLARPLERPSDLAPLVDRLANDHIICLGEASHGTHEFYTWRAELSRKLIEQGGVRWIGVEGDWPDRWRINQWIRGEGDQGLDAATLLARFERWPTWLWANDEVARFLTWLRGWNSVRPEDEFVGFYGLDVYPLWDSLAEIIAWLDANAPDVVPSALVAWQCFAPYDQDPQRYAWSTRLVPESCEAPIAESLNAVRERALQREGDEEAFDACRTRRWPPVPSGTAA